MTDAVGLFTPDADDRSIFLLVRGLISMMREYYFIIYRNIFFSQLLFVRREDTEQKYS